MHRPLLLAAAAVLTASSVCNAVIVIGARRLIQPADYLAGGTAQYEGRLGAFLATPIAPRYFVTAVHIGDGGGGGHFFYHNGTTTETDYTATYIAHLNDLAVWQLNPGVPSFHTWAPIYTASNEVGRPLSVMGRGTDKGAEVRVPQNTGALRGWMWGAADGLVSSGTNTVSSTPVLTTDPAFGGDYLAFTFNQTAGPSEAIYSSGDSGGAVFITDPADGRVKLAGINSLVDGNWSYAEPGPYFPAAMFDARGFYTGDETTHQLIPAGGVFPAAAASYATRISSRAAFLLSTISFCGTADFNGDGDVGTDADIEAFFACLAGNCCAACGSADFNGDGDVGTDSDIEAFFRVLAGGSC